MRAYSEMPSAVSSVPVDVLVEQNSGSAAEDGRSRATVDVHASKHPHWSFAADVLVEEPRAVRWQGRGVTVRHEGDLSWRVGVDPDSDPRLVGEAVFHLLRSIALYRRDTAAGPLVHASGVLDRRGRAVLFSGSVLAGKTTLLTESVIGRGATPLTNDRALIRFFGTQADVLTWPSYASFCEGTILNYPALAGAAEAFEHDANPVRTICHDRPLVSGFDKDTKRIYPMSWFTDATGASYAASAPLGTLVITRLIPGTGRSELRELDLGTEADRGRVIDLFTRECFDQAEPSFLPWHGMSLPRSPWTADRIVSRLETACVRVLALEAEPGDLSVLEEIL
ncbi:hypothetical protein ADL05_16730 [Nocardiopsis sp. NRRL B-16309]|nr:hypothetical protein ADL05_16730 [Nocardiopsis sp. NRRL B-16309]